MRSLTLPRPAPARARPSPCCSGLERAVLVEHVGDATRHAGREVAAGAAEHHHDAAGHVFAAVVAGAFDHRDRAGIAHGETFAGNAAEVAFALDRAVEHGVADDDRFLRHDAGVGGRAHDDASARESLADVVVGVAFELEGHAARAMRRSLAGGAGELHVDGVVGQPFVAVALGDLAGEHGAGGAVDARPGFDPHRRAAVQRAAPARSACGRGWHGSCDPAPRNCGYSRRRAPAA